MREKAKTTTEKQKNTSWPCVAVDCLCVAGCVRGDDLGII